VADPTGVGVASDRIAIVLADDHALIRSGLRRVLDGQADLTVVGEASDVESALALTERHQPRVVVLDLNMPGTPTLPAIPRFLEASPESAIVVLTMEAEPGFARTALSAGARGYVLKDAAEADLVEAVRSVLAGGTYLDPSLGARLAQMEPEPGGTHPGLSHGEPNLAVGTDFAGHRIDAFVGQGGMGIVFRATDLTLGRTVALKVIAPDAAGKPVFRARFERECRVAAAIDHPHVVQVYHAGQDDGLLYLTMRYIDGTDLRRLLRRENRLDAARAVSIVGQIAGALDEAHALGLVHRDVKPANVLLAERSGRDHAYLTDFGITRGTGDDHLTRTGVALGSVDYIAPEQAHGATVDARADTYSLACILFQMLTGSVVFDRDGDLEKLWAHVHDPPPRLLSLNPELPPGLQDVLDRALAKNPGDRYASATQLAQDASEALGQS
jgi:DNA-binding NarL/FixJ family response regulator/tRNA A-37 threonylcarbamoyl transferase component Bud32